MAARLTTYVVVAIVAATLIAGLIVGAQRDDSSGPVDLIIHNARVYPAERTGAMAEAVAVRGNQILRVGSEREIMRLRRPQTTVVDAKGAAVLPGFNDAHVHFIEGGLALDQVNLLGAEGVEELQDRVTAWAGTHVERGWIVGRGWTYGQFGDSLPTRQQLDAATDDRPAVMFSADGRSAWLNTKALEAAKIARRTPNPKNGAIVREARTGLPTGLLKEGAVALIWKAAPAPTREDRARALRAAIAVAHEHGVTSVQDAGGSADDLALFDEARRANELTMRVYEAVAAPAKVSPALLERLEAISREYSDDPLLKSGAVTIDVDGDVESQTAAMIDPYANRASDGGVPRLQAVELNRFVQAMDAHGWQVMANATGDAAVRMALDALEQAARTRDRAAREGRHRIERAELVAPDDLARFGALGVIASLQPAHALPHMPEIDLWGRLLGPERAARGWAANSLAKASGRLAFGSDWPSAPMDPMLALHAAVTRTTADGLPDGGWFADERLALKRAIDAFTSDAAWASFDEHRKGVIAPGMLADLVVLSDDIFEGPPARLATTTVAATIFDGKIVYQRAVNRGTN